MVYEIREPETAAPLFAGWQETLIWSCLQGVMGKVYGDSAETPASAMALLGDFCFFAGRPNRELVTEEVGSKSRAFLIMVPPLDETGEGWAREIEAAYEGRCKQVERYAIKKEPGIFDRKRLETIVSSLKPGYEVKLIDEEIFEQTRDCSIYAEQYQLYADMEVLPDDAVADLLDRVTVWPDGRVEVLLKFLDELPALSGAAGRTEAAQ